MIAYLGRLPQTGVAGWFSIGESIVYKHYAMADKTIMANGNQLTNKTVRLYFAAVTNYHPFLDFGKRPDKTVVANYTFIQVTRLYQTQIGAGLQVAYAGMG